jgi:hypothetical protein
MESTFLKNEAKAFNCSGQHAFRPTKRKCRKQVLEVFWFFFSKKNYLPSFLAMDATGRWVPGKSWTRGISQSPLASI